jgi:BirA family biotin operon repressor/biotin-[acetyl-CoA-carboxylase] ligase
LKKYFLILFLFMFVEYYESLPSTNDRVRELMLQTPPKLPALVVAKQQTAGRGRPGKSWWSGKGALLMSIGLDLQSVGLNRHELVNLSPVVGNVLVEILQRRFLFGTRVSVRLPNDIYADGKKIAGILIESPSPQFAVIGIGMNVNNSFADIPPELQQELSERKITSLIDLCGQETAIPPLVADVWCSLLQKLPLSDKII